MSQTVVGLDPSLTGTAVCVAGSEPKRFTSKPAHGLFARIVRFVGLTEIVAQEIPKDALVMIEGYSFGSQGDAGRWLAEYGGILRARLIPMSREVVEVAPLQLKKFATGKGKGDKDVVRAYVERYWGVIHETSDETDAFVLAQIGLCYSGQKEPDNEAQREVIETLKNGPKKKTRKKAKEPR